MSTRYFALVDCNYFYVACELLFRPELRNLPVVVLSNNDGCVVSRSPQAKALGIGMGVPKFKVQSILDQHQVVIFSSNYALYADLSSRVMSTLESLVSEASVSEASAVEVYSIDEAFLDLSAISPEALPAYGQRIRKRVRRWVGLPVCVGIGPTKTLAKAANALAKADPQYRGVVVVRSVTERRRLLAQLPVGEVWGIGRRLAQRLQMMGITTAAQLVAENTISQNRIRRLFNVSVERTVSELQGICCLGWQTVPRARQQVICSRSFGKRVRQYRVLKEAVCEYLARACQKLRDQQQVAQVFTIFIRSSAHAEEAGRYRRSATGQLHYPSSDTRDFMVLVEPLLREIWRDGVAYAKAGVVLVDVHRPCSYQMDMFVPARPRKASQALMQVMDQINGSGLGKVYFASQGVQQVWQMLGGYRSPAYTTRWSDLPVVRN